MLGRQRDRVFWNLRKLVLVFVEEVEGRRRFREEFEKEEGERKVEEVENEMKIVFESEYNRKFLQLMKKRIRIVEEEEEGKEIVLELLDLLELFRCDYNMFFLNLMELDRKRKQEECDSSSSSCSYSSFASSLCVNFYRTSSLEMNEKFEYWYRKYEKAKKGEAVNGVNPSFVPRNYILQKAIEKSEKDDFSLVEDLFSLFSADRYLFADERNISMKEEFLSFREPPLTKAEMDIEVSCSS